MRTQAFHDLGLAGGEIAGFADVFTHVVKLDAAVVMKLDQFEIAGADGAVGMAPPSW